MKKSLVFNVCFKDTNSSLISLTHLMLQVVFESITYERIKKHSNDVEQNIQRYITGLDFEKLNKVYKYTKEDLLVAIHRDIKEICDFYEFKLELVRLHNSKENTNEYIEI